MKINFGENLMTVVQTGAYETREFENLSYFKKQEILTEIFQRAFLTFWIKKVENSEWHRRRVRNSGEEDFFNKEPLAQTMKLYSKAMKNMESVSDGEESKGTRKHKATADVDFMYDMNHGILDVKIVDFKTIEPKAEKNFRISLEKELEAVKVAIEEKFDMRTFLECFYNTLHIHEMTSVTGNDAGYVYHIFRNVKEVYPLFKKESYGTQLEILRKGYRLARSFPGNSREIHTFAKAIFEAIATHGNGYLIEQLYAKEKTTERYANFTKVYEKREDRYDPEHPSTVWEKDALIYSTYEHTTMCNGSATTLRTSFLAYDLWHMLVGSMEGVSFA